MEYPDSNNDRLLEHLKTALDDFKTQAPQGLWEGIVHDLENGSEIIDQSLKTASVSLQEKAPSFIWSNIESEISSPIDADDQIDAKLRSAAEGSRQAPESIWYGIEQKLNIDQIWNGLQPGLDRMRNAYIFRKRLSYLSVAAALLLLFRGCGSDFEFFVPKYNPVIVQTGHSETGQNIGTVNDETKSITQYQSSSEPKFQAESKNHNISKETVLPVKPGFPPAKVISEIKQYSNSFPKETLKEKFSEKTLASAESEIFGKNEKVNQISPVALEKRKLRLLESFENKISEAVLPVSDLSAAFKNPFQTKYDIGIIGVFNSTILINDQNTKKLNVVRADDIHTNSSPSFSYGLQVAVKFAKRQSIITEFWFDSKIKQEYRYYVAGRLHRDNAELNYVKVNLSYRPVLFSYGKNYIVATAGLYLSNLKNISYSSSIQQRHFSPAAPNLWDAGLSLGIGQEHEIAEAIVLDYGLRNEIGVSSIFKTNRYLPMKTNLLGYGAYLSLRYRF